MKALLYRGVRDIDYATAAEPVIGADSDVIIRVRATAICGSDLHVYHGRETGLDIGTVMGHEFIGEIVAAGKEVRRFKAGDHIFSPFFNCCGNCFYCRNGLSCRCNHGSLFGWVEKGEGLHGAQAEYVRVPYADTTLYHQPAGLTEDGALFLCDILPTGFFCADMALKSLLLQGQPTGGKLVTNVLVIGCGPVGLMGILGFQHLGMERIFALDIVPERLELARKLGARPIQSGRDDLKEYFLDLTEGRGADVVAEYVGNPAAQQLAYDLVRPGGVISVAGVHNAERFAFTPVDLYNKNLTYLTGRCPVQRYIPDLLPLAMEQADILSEVVSHRLPLGDGRRAYELFDRKEDGCTKIILTP